MRRGLSLAFISLILALSAYASYLWLRALESSMRDFTPPFDTSSLFFDLPTAPVSRKLVLIVAEGIPPDETAQMQCVRELKEAGAWIPLNRPGYFGPYTPWVTLITGADPDLVGVYLTPSPVPSGNLFEALKRSGRTAALAGPGFWGELLSSCEDCLYASFFSRDDEPARVAKEAARFLRLFQPAFTLVHLRGMTRPRYADVLVGDILAEVDLREDTAIVMLASAQGSALVMAGKGVKPGVYAPASVLDLAPTLAALAGAVIPPLSEGDVLFQALSMPEGLRAEKAVALARQRVNLADLYLATLVGKGLYEGIRGDAMVAQSSLEVGNFGGAFELASLTITGANRAMSEARGKVARSGQGRRLLLVAAFFVAAGAIFFLWRRGEALILLLGGALSLALNAYLFRMRWPGVPSALVNPEVPPPPDSLWRTAVSLALPALLPLAWRLLEGKRDLMGFVESLAGYGAAAVYFTWLPVLFCFWRMGAEVTWPLPSPSLYRAYCLGLWQVILTGVVVLLPVFLATLVTGFRVLLRR